MTSPLGDTGHAPHSSQRTESQPALFTACFSVVAATDPHTLSRVLEPFTKRAITPSYVHAERAGANGELMHIDLQLADTDADTAWRLANDLRGQWLVEKVLTSEKAAADIPS